MEDNKWVGVFDQGEKLVDLVVHALSVQLKITVVKIQSLSELLSFINKSGVLVVHNESFNNPAFDGFVERAQNLKIICIGETYKKDNVTILTKPIVTDELINTASKMLDISKDEVANYYPIPIGFFRYFDYSPCDVFIKLNMNDKNAKYVKRLFKNYEFDSGEIEKFEQGKVKLFYVELKDRDILINYMMDSFTPKLYEKEGGNRGYLDVDSDMQKIVGTLLENTLISQDVFEMAKLSIQTMTGTVQNSKNLLSLLKNVMRNKSSFNYKHSFLISVFCYEIMLRSDWAKTSRLDEQHNVITYAAFLHDAILKDDDLVKIRSAKDFLRNELSDENKSLVKNHAKFIADLVGETKAIPAGVSLIIRHHHGTTNGIGFAPNYSASLPQLAIIFIVVEYFVHQLLDPKENEASVIKIFSNCDNEFPLPSYRKVVFLLKKIFKISNE